MAQQSIILVTMISMFRLYDITGNFNHNYHDYQNITHLYCYGYITYLDILNTVLCRTLDSLHVLLTLPWWKNLHHSKVKSTQHSFHFCTTIEITYCFKYHYFDVVEKVRNVEK